MFSPRRAADIECGIVYTVWWIQCNDSRLESGILWNESAPSDVVIAVLIRREDCAALIGSDVVSWVPGVTFTVFQRTLSGSQAGCPVVWTWSCPRCWRSTVSSFSATPAADGRHHITGTSTRRSFSTGTLFSLSATMGKLREHEAVTASRFFPGHFVCLKCAHFGSAGEYVPL